MGKSRIKPEDPFPENLNQLEDNQVEVLNSKVHRQLEVEYVQEGSPDPETEHRREELNEELDDRDLLSDARIQHSVENSREDDSGVTPEESDGSTDRGAERRSDQRR